MNGLYSRLAATGIRKNGKSYIPYILTAALMISVFYIITFLSANRMLKQMTGGSGMAMILQFGMVVMGIFSAIFLFYTNSFLIKRRKKEFGLYNILGLGKGQIAKVLVRETIFVYLIAEVVGLGVGILFSKLAEMLASRMLRGRLNYSFYVDPIAVISALVLFAVIFAVILLNSLRQLFFSRPIELLHSENTGEKPPRTNIPAAVIGFGALGFAYYMALKIKDPGMAIGLFFIAVILVIIATYLLFIAGSVVICRTLQKNKNSYYKTKNFVSLSQMVFRMRKNGAGLASICILSTMVLVTLSSTVSLYAGIPDMVGTEYDNDITIWVQSPNGSVDTDWLIEQTNRVVDEAGKPFHNANMQHYLQLRPGMLELAMGLEERIAELGFDSLSLGVDGEFAPISEADENIKALGLELGEYDIAVFEPSLKIITSEKTVKFGQYTLNIIPIETTPDSLAPRIFYDNQEYAQIYVRDKGVLDKLLLEYRKLAEDANKALGVNEYWVPFLNAIYGFDVSNEKGEYEGDLWELVDMLRNELHTECDGRFGMDTEFAFSVDTVATLIEEYYGLYGGLLFLGIMLGGVFALSAALIMYYKQISEGYEDAARFEILRKVGMTRREIRSAINSQVLKVFFLPLAAAGVHMIFAFPMIARMLNIFNFYNVNLFGLVTLIGFAVFGLLYVLFYKITSKSYMGIVGANEKKERSNRQPS